MPFFPLKEKAASKKFKDVIAHFIIRDKQTLELHSSIEPIPEHMEEERVGTNTTKTQDLNKITNKFEDNKKTM